MRAISILSLFVLFSAGCATSKPKEWRQSLWHVENHTGENPEIGMLETEGLVFNIIVTEFREVVYMPYPPYEPKVTPTFIAVSVTCRNQGSETLVLETNPIQMIGPSHMLAKEFPLEHVRYKLYGGEMREGAQLGRLAELSEPVPVGSTVSSAILAGIVEGLRASERSSIVSEMYQKEASQYQLYYHSFAPASLPGGVATSWTQYYPYITGPIKVILQGYEVKDGVSFTRVLPSQSSLARIKSHNTPVPTAVYVVGIAIGVVGAIFLLDQTH